MRPPALLLALGLLVVAGGCTAGLAEVGQTTGGPTPSAAAADPRQAQVVARIKRLGGTVEINAKLPGSPVVGADLHGIHRSELPDLVAALPELRTLNLYGTRFTDADLDHLRWLTHLQTLNLSGTAVTDAGLARLPSPQELRVLYLTGTAITDAGLVFLRGLPHLQELGLYHTRVTDAGLAQLRGHKELSHLTLGGKGITDQGLAYLKDLPHLREVDLLGTGVTEAGVRMLQQARPGLKVVR